jgi:anion-transporting  ArsA/GET3 family ATPase
VVIVPLESLAASSLSSLLQKRVLFFVGKGGVGKTTVAAAIAVTAARLGRRTLLIEIEESHRAARLLGLPGMENPANIVQTVSPTLSVLSVSGAAALEEYLQLLIPVKRLVRMLVESRPYQYFVAAAPGLKELLTIGKVWYEERQQDLDAQRPRWDLILVDLPATGHALQYLHMPQAAKETFSEGIVHREAERITTWLRDADKTAVNLVTTAEELPVNEILDAHQQLRDTLQLPLGALFLNRLHAAPLSMLELAHLRQTLKKARANNELIEHVFGCAHMEIAFVKEQEKNLLPLQQLSLPRVSLPVCRARGSDPLQLTELSYHIEAMLSATEAAASVANPTPHGRKTKRSS